MREEKHYDLHNAGFTRNRNRDNKRKERSGRHLKSVHNSRVIEISIHSGDAFVRFKLVLLSPEKFLKITPYGAGSKLIQLDSSCCRYTVTFERLETGSLPLRIECFNSHGIPTRSVHRKLFLV